VAFGPKAFELGRDELQLLADNKEATKADIDKYLAAKRKTVR
jgi:hypothetical protein